MMCLDDWSKVLFLRLERECGGGMTELKNVFVENLHLLIKLEGGREGRVLAGDKNLSARQYWEFMCSNNTA